MKEIIKMLKHVIPGMVLLGLILTQNINAQNTNVPDLNNDQCTHMGTFFQGYGDCNFRVLLDDGELIMPAEEISYAYPDSSRVQVGFSVIDSVNWDCFSGLLVNLTCIQLVDTVPACKAYFKGLVNDSLQHFTYLFLDQSEGISHRRLWTINGDTVSIASNLLFTFNEPGTYSVCLSIFSDDGCTDTYCKDWVVGEPEQCSANFTFYPLDMLMNIADSLQSSIYEFGYQFMDASEEDVLDWEWEVDGEVVANTSDMVYIFQDTGVYSVCLTIQTADSCVSTTCQQVVAESHPLCRAYFDYYSVIDSVFTEVDSILDSTTVQTTVPSDMPDGNRIQFIDGSWGNMIDWHWDFGDGDVSNEQNPAHEYKYAGEYEVCLTTETYDGCEDIHCETIVIDSSWSCNAYFEYCTYQSANSDTLRDMNHIIGFKNLSTPAYSYPVWDFGDGSTSNDQNPVHQYKYPGTYSVCLTIYNETGCNSSYSEEVPVDVDCEINFTYEMVVPECSGFEIGHLFYVPDNTIISSYYWDFGDDSYSYEPEIIHIYNDVGVYEVCLTAQLENGCQATKCLSVNNQWNAIDSVYATSCNATILPSEYAQKKLQILNMYPVPAQNEVTFELGSDIPVKLDFQLMDMMGQTVVHIPNYHIEAGNSEFTVPIPDLKEGIYIYKLSSKHESKQGQLSVTD